MVTSQIAGSTRVTSAFALLPSGDHNRVVVIQSENPTPLGVSLFGHPSSTPREAADCAMKAFARGVASATSSDDEEEKSIYEWIKESTDNYYYYYTALRLRAPLILEMLQREASENSSGGTLKVDKLVEETEYCNDGNCETFWNYETVVIGCRFGLFRLQ